MTDRSAYAPGLSAAKAPLLDEHQAQHADCSQCVFRTVPQPTAHAVGLEEGADAAVASVHESNQEARPGAAATGNAEGDGFGVDVRMSGED